MTSYLLSGPAAEPVTLTEARSFLRVDDTDQDDLITTLITAARLHIEGITGRALLAQSWRVVLDEWPLSGTVRLPVAPLISLTSVTVTDADGTATDLATTGLYWDDAATPPLLFLPAGYGAGPVPRDRQGIEIDYVAGYGSDAADVPALLCQALLTLVAYWFENRDVVIIAGSGTIIPAGFDLMVAPYRGVRL